MSVAHVIKNGTYLGYCECKGYVYSLFRGYAKDGRKRYTIVALRYSSVDVLMTYCGTC